MHERIQELEARLAKDSHNSSRPPSSDSPFKKPPPRSRCQPSGRKPGGQPGRCGVTRSLVDDPDQYVIIPLPGTCAGGRGGTGIATTGLAERRQVVEVVIQREVIEYRIVSGTCACGRAQRSTFPVGIEAPVQYGPGGSAFAVYMTPYPLRPYQRTTEVLNERAGLTISPGPFLVGVLGHHHRSAYERYQCLHAFCKAHHLRQLIAIAERSPSQPWATDMITLLGQANALSARSRTRTLRRCPPATASKSNDMFNSLVLTFQGRPPMPQFGVAE